MRKCFVALAFLCGSLASSTSLYGQNFPMSLNFNEKILGLSSIWQEVNYNFASHEKFMNRDFDSIYMSYIQLVVKSANDYEYYRLLQRFTASLNDANTFVSLPAYLSDSVTSPPVIIKEIRGRFYVTNVDRQLANRLPVGSEVTRINGFEIRSYLSSEVLPYIAAGTEHGKMAAALETILDGWINTNLLLNFITPDGKTHNEVFTRTRQRRVNWVREFPDDRPVKLDWLNRETALITVNRIDDKTLEQFPSPGQLVRATSLIIDLRNCNNTERIGIPAQIASLFADSNFMVLPGFNTRNLPYSFINPEGDLSKAGSKSKNRFYAFHHPDTLFLPQSTERIPLPVILLAGSKTGNSAEHLIMMLKQVTTNITIIGEPSAGSIGSCLVTPLPGGGILSVLAKYDLYFKDAPAASIEITPHIFVTPDIKSLLNGEDVVMNKALELIVSSSK